MNHGPWHDSMVDELTCLSKGTGSAFKYGGLQGDGLKAVLAAAMVFGRACGAASTTFNDSKMTPK